jgi:FG-GAP-like repeat/Insecticide toxin TcdB middle/N-terminal region
MQYGNTTDSEILAQGKGAVRVWALNRVNDSKSNFFTVTYNNDTANGQYYPVRIDYTGNAAAGVATYNSVQFNYQNRADVVPMYQGGSLVKTTVVLTDIFSYAGSVITAHYSLGYQLSGSTGRSELVSLKLCAADGSCLPATNFTWQVGAANGSFSESTQTLGGGWGWNQINGLIPITGDFNGDGRTDYVLIDGRGYPYQYVTMANSDGTFSYQTQSLPSGWGWDITSGHHLIPITGDFNGDGKTDYLLMDASGYPTQYVFLSNGDGTFNEQARTMPNGWSWNLTTNPGLVPITGDFNGDGKTDYLLVDGGGRPYQYVFISNGDGTFSGLTELLPNGMSFSSSDGLIPITGDFNGDGNSDYLLVDGRGNPYQYVFLANGDGTFSEQTEMLPNGWVWNTTTASQNHLIPILGDFNGDGRADYLLIDGMGNPYQYLFLSKGDGTFVGQLQSLPNGWAWNEMTNPNSILPATGDFNGDGKTDYLLVDTAGHPYQYVFLNNGDATFAGQTQPLPNGLSFTGNFIPVSGDFNGDGRSEYLLVNGNGYSTQYVFTSNGPIGDLLVSITTGTGAVTSLTYLPLTNSSVYSKGSNASYPVQDIEAAIYVISRVDASNGVGGAFSSTYSYAGAKADVSGRGFLGFGETSVTDLQTNIVQTTIFNQIFPYIGLAGVTTKTLGSATLNQAITYFEFSNASGAASIGTPSVAGAPYQVSVVSQNVTQNADLDGSPLPTMSTTYQYDSFGNATQVATSMSDSFSKTTAGIYTNDTTNWFLGRLVQTTVTGQSPQ